MEILIKIPQETIAAVNHDRIGIHDLTTIFDAIRHCYILPKNHGELVESDKITEFCTNEIKEISENWLNYRSPSEVKSPLYYLKDNMKTIAPVVVEGTKNERCSR